MFELRMFIVLLALLTTSMLAGAGVYEQLVLDPAWPARPDIVRPANGGADRKRYWVPSNILAVVAMIAAIWAAWPAPSARSWVLCAAVCSLVINVATVVYFAPRVLRVERDGVAPNHPHSTRWVALSRWRTPVAIVLDFCLIIAVMRLAATS
jgi:hypothetical protein